MNHWLHIIVSEMKHCPFCVLIYLKGRYYAVQKGMEILAQQSTPETKTAVIGLLEKLETDKKALQDKLKDPENQAPHVINFANKIFDKANTDDREGKATA
mgnify:CR=1 FL=1